MQVAFSLQHFEVAVQEYIQSQTVDVVRTQVQKDFEESASQDFGEEEKEVFFRIMSENCGCPILKIAK